MEFCLREFLTSVKGEFDGDWGGFSTDALGTLGGGFDEELENKRIKDGADGSLSLRLARRSAMVVAPALLPGV